jgi:hypothetical protein
MDNFEIDPSTSEEVTQGQDKHPERETAELVRIQDGFDFFNCLLTFSFKAVAITL